MTNWIKDNWGPLLFFFSIIVLIYIVFFAYPNYLKRKHLAEGWIEPTGWNCPEEHSIKANLKSHIYHMPWDQYYARTNAMSGECFDTYEHAEAQGFRAILNGN